MKSLIILFFCNVVSYCLAVSHSNNYYLIKKSDLSIENILKKSS